ncbi:solute carrier family 22 member 3-like [Paramacrobiotus metropolitanus]|uniref:solute carrier family 22 member 3-like n=1 Tax=Paramacrobiotus metropolitanus TaxID=2943436 RepID=UPI002446472A|nr:solute carrier family 22 member 3-like [Paramacrobiotus metropolitanus]
MYLAPTDPQHGAGHPGLSATFTVLLSVGYTIGGMVFSGLAYYSMPRLSWRYFTLIITLPFITYASYFWVMPESPRWLLAYEKFDSLRQHLQTMAKINGARISDATGKKIEQLCEGVTQAKREEKVTKHNSYVDLFRRPQIRKCTLIMIVLTLPAALFTKLICDRLGRKITIMICFLFGGTACLATLEVPSGKAASAGVLTLFLFAKLFVTMGLLNFLAAFANGIGRVVVYAGYHNPSISLVIFGGIMVFASVCSVFLPETLKT